MFDYSHSRPDFYLAKDLAVLGRLDNSFQALDLAVEVSVAIASSQNGCSCGCECDIICVDD